MHHAKFWLAPTNQVNDLTCSSFPNNQERSLPDHIYVSSFSLRDKSNLSNDDTPKRHSFMTMWQMETTKINLTSDPLWCILLSSTPRVLQIVGVISVQCDSYSK